MKNLLKLRPCKISPSHKAIFSRFFDEIRHAEINKLKDNCVENCEVDEINLCTVFSYHVVSESTVNTNLIQQN